MLWLDVQRRCRMSLDEQLKTTFLYSRQQWSPSHGYEAKYASNIFVADVQVQIHRKYALRGGSSTLLEELRTRLFDSRPRRIPFARSGAYTQVKVYNLGETKKTLLQRRVSWSKGKTRVQLNYGRNRGGYICSGGYAATVPPTPASNLLLTQSLGI